MHLTGKQGARAIQTRGVHFKEKYGIVPRDRIECRATPVSDGGTGTFLRQSAGQRRERLRDCGFKKGRSIE
jgi:hypothetical protein